MIDITKLGKARKSIFLYIIFVFVILSIIYSIISMCLQVNTNIVKRSEVVSNEALLVKVENSIISTKVTSMISDLLYVSDTLAIHNVSEKGLGDTEKEWASFSERKKKYDEIRYIDIDGNEKVRINYSDKGSVVIKSDALQNKKDMYYFTDTISLKKGQVYISKLDLNIENGEIEEPIKPMIRISTPVFDKNDKLIGIVVLNYFAEYLLKDFANISTTSVGNFMLLDSNGYWIFNSNDKTKEWSFMYEDKKNISFKNEFPNEWNNISKKESGSFITPNGYYSYSNVIPTNTNSTEYTGIPQSSVILGCGNWYIVSCLSKDNKNNQIFNTTIQEYLVYIFKNQVIAFAFIFLISIIFSVLLTVNSIAKQKIKYFSEFDTMTGIFNRRAGFELLEKSYRDLMKTAGNISICFLDINGLKDVNDTLGHEAGDELILSIVNGIKTCIRQADYIARLGGDEFLIVFINAKQEQAENIWSRISDEYNKINETENRKYIITASHGICEFTFGPNEYIDTIINSADEKMYAEKKIMKENFDVIRKEILD